LEIRPRYRIDRIRLSNCALYVSDTHIRAATESKNVRRERHAAARGPSTRRRHRSILQVYINEEATMETAKLFMNGRSQAVRLPKGFRFEGEEVFIKKVGNAVVLLPRQRSWETLYESLGSFSEDFMEEREQPVAGQERAEAPFD
jgi:antitoxin VapB